MAGLCRVHRRLEASGSTPMRRRTTSSSLSTKAILLKSTRPTPHDTNRSLQAMICNHTLSNLLTVNACHRNLARLLIPDSGSRWLRRRSQTSRSAYLRKGYKRLLHIRTCETMRLWSQHRRILHQTRIILPHGIEQIPSTRWMRFPLHSLA